MWNVLQLPNLSQLDSWSDEDFEQHTPTCDPVQKLLTFVLALAVKDQASSVHYQLWQDGAAGENKLTYVVGGVRYEMVPAPPEVAAALLAEARSLLVPRGPLGWLRRLLARVTGGCSGQFTLLDANGCRSNWCGAVWSVGTIAGLEFYRFYPSGAQAEAKAVSQARENPNS